MFSEDVCELLFIEQNCKVSVCLKGVWDFHFVKLPSGVFCWDMLIRKQYGIHLSASHSDNQVACKTNECVNYWTEKDHLYSFSLCLIHHTHKEKGFFLNF